VSGSGKGEERRVTHHRFLKLNEAGLAVIFKTPSLYWFEDNSQSSVLASQEIAPTNFLYPNKQLSERRRSEGTSELRGSSADT